MKFDYKQYAERRNEVIRKYKLNKLPLKKLKKIYKKITESIRKKETLEENFIIDILKFPINLLYLVLGSIVFVGMFIFANLIFIGYDEDDEDEYEDSMKGCLQKWINNEITSDEANEYVIFYCKKLNIPVAKRSDMYPVGYYIDLVHEYAAKYTLNKRLNDIFKVLSKLDNYTKDFENEIKSIVRNSVAETKYYLDNSKNTKKDFIKKHGKNIHDKIRNELFKDLCKIYDRLISNNLKKLEYYCYKEEMR